MSKNKRKDNRQLIRPEQEKRETAKNAPPQMQDWGEWLRNYRKKLNEIVEREVRNGISGESDT